ncbi:MAG: hypothetical protein CYPHOPRED_000899 [Cyphobasidiales sp. Tagirdzhanova-0007]|nr:MAG: hypothetical protein CYPHOPRED_000899 [Cyphobasidiales sp. Tagirdzhanova-0007]
MGARVTRKRERPWVDIFYDEARPTTHLSPPGKKRKSNRGFSLSNTARTLLTTAAEAFMFVAVVAIATYQLWYGQQQLEYLEEDRADSRTRRQARQPPSSDLLLPEASQRELPPPYEAVCNIRPESPSLSIQSLSLHSSPWLAL